MAVGYLVTQQQRRRRLQERFGPEYERTVGERENRRAAEQELREREQRHATLDIKTLAPEVRSTYTKKWAEVQERFVDAPGFAVTEADHLVTAVMADRGYPTEGFEQQVSDLSVSYAPTLDHYRKAHEISSRAARQEASTEELRQAMVHYRALFEELLEDTTGSGRERENGHGRHDHTESVNDDDGRTATDDGRTVTHDGRTVTDDGRTLTDDGRTVGGSGRGTITGPEGTAAVDTGRGTVSGPEGSAAVDTGRGVAEPDRRSVVDPDGAVVDPERRAAVDAEREETVDPDRRGPVNNDDARLAEDRTSRRNTQGG
ncbi:hypothetical protein [Sphaerisporangium corydalis]|uniref:Uncharacterized protein n=1 Tax=Sphaerisporangium corydalis TaxID=1441875 RepID=A0ABV9E8G8_9ACTN|nr:hypothetical protein [Sphaerisporangium corydalis]